METFEAGSVGDITAELQSRIDAAVGGGRVVVPAGHWRCAAIFLRSGVELYLAHGARLHAIPDPTRYPSLPDGRVAALVNAVDAQGIALTGTGCLDGDGDSMRWGDEVDPDEFRFSQVRLVECRDVRIHDVGLYWTRHWAVHLLRCSDVQIRGCSIIARRDRINSDGIDPDDCQRVRISDCRISTGDDAIVIKSTSGGVCEDILVSNCQLDSSCAAIKVGTESTGTIRNVLFANCIVRDSNVGLAAYLKDGGIYQDIRMTGCLVEASNDFPVLIDHTPRFHGETQPGVLEGVTIADCIIRSAGRLFIGGTAGARVRGVTLRDIDWYCIGPVAHGPDIDRPLGAARVRPDPKREAVGTTPHHLVLDGCDDLTVTMRLHGDVDRRFDRGLACLRCCTNARLELLAPPVPDGIEAVLQQDCDHITVT